MRSIRPSETIRHTRYALLSSLRTLGMTLADGSAVVPGELMLVSAGEPIGAPARTMVIDHGPPALSLSQGGSPAYIAYDAEDAAIGDAFVAALAAGPMQPTAADPESLALFALAERVAEADITVLIGGPTGTGKEVLARAIHNRSTRADGPFIALNCAALPESMLEAMLFGHQKGSFTGASAAGEGFFRAAEGGTLLLDEIAEMPLALQAKLLRVLQEREVVPIGATQPVKVDVRIVACANRDLQAEVAAGRFRADLYYRLSVFPLSTRALVDRPRDIPALVATMILRHAGDRAHVPWPSREALALLGQHDWPGNVRELENVVQRALLLCRGGSIEAHDIVFDRATPAVAANDGGPATLGRVVQLSEFAAIRETLAACGGSRIETARRLGISERTLRYRLARAREQGDDIVAGADRRAYA